MALLDALLVMIPVSDVGPGPKLGMQSLPLAFAHSSGPEALFKWGRFS